MLIQPLEVPAIMWLPNAVKMVDFFAAWGLRSEGGGGKDSFDWFGAGDVYQYWLVFEEGGDEKEAGE